MVKFDSFDIHLDQPNGCYYAGQVISGKLLTSTSQVLQFNELSFTLKGEARTNWVAKVSDNIYDSLEPYLNETKLIVGGDLGTGPTLVAPGSQSIPFYFRPSAHLPSSYEGEFGYVRYTLVAKADVSTGAGEPGKETVVDRPITIFASVELRQLSPPNDCGLSKKDILEIVGCCGSSGQISAVLSIPKTAFLIGQTMPVRIVLENLTKRRQPPACITFVQDIHFRSISLFQSACDQKTVSRVIDAVKIDCPEQGKVLVRDAGIRIPLDLPPTSIGYTLITATYRVRLEMERRCDIVLPVGMASKA